jgi:hypothetical protein
MRALRGNPVERAAYRPHICVKVAAGANVQPASGACREGRVNGGSMRGRLPAFDKAYRAWSAGWICPNEPIGNLSESPSDCPGLAELRVAPMSMG